MNTLSSLLNSDISYAFAWTLLHSLWQASLIALVLMAIHRLARSASANTRYVINLSGLMTCLALSAATFAHYHNAVASAGSTWLSAPLVLQYEHWHWAPIYRFINAQVDLLVTLWALGFSVHLIRFALDYGRAYGLGHHDCEPVDARWQQRFTELATHLDLRKPVQFKTSKRVNSLCTLGHFTPIILLPIGMLTCLSESEIRALLAHELAHIKRCDYLVNSLQSAAKILYFFNPAVYWISRQLDRERENACDDVAVENCGDKWLYARSLTKVGELTLRLDSVMAANRGSNLMARVKRLFRDTQPAAQPLDQLMAIVGIALLALTVNVNAREIAPKAAPPTAAETAPANPPAAAPAKATATPEPATVAAEAVSAATAPPAPPSVAAPEAPDAPLPVPATAELDFIQQREGVSQTHTVPRAPQPLQLAEANRSEMPKPSPAVSQPGLEQVESDLFNEFYVAASIKTTTTRKVYVPPTQAHFAKRWLDHYKSDVTARYQTDTLAAYAQMLRGSLIEQFETQGWQVVQQAANDALTVRAELMDLYVFAPDTLGITQTIIKRAGQSGLKVQVLTPGGDTLMQIVDYRQTRFNDAGLLANRATHYRYFSMLFDDWAAAVEDHMDLIMSVIETQAQS